jgi:hypothetical protein
VNTEARDRCLHAIAYLKMDLPDDGGATIELSREESMVMRNVGYGLLEMYLVDRGEDFLYIQYRDLAEAGMSEDELHVKALENLSTLVKEQLEVHQDGSIYTVLAGGNFEASLILHDAFWSKGVARLAPGGFVAAFPARDVLMFGDVSDTTVVPRLREICGALEAKPMDHRLTTTLYRRVDTHWEPLQSP